MAEAAASGIIAGDEAMRPCRQQTPATKASQARRRKLLTTSMIAKNAATNSNLPTREGGTYCAF